MPGRRDVRLGLNKCLQLVCAGIFKPVKFAGGTALGTLNALAAQNAFSLMAATAAEYCPASVAATRACSASLIQLSMVT